MVVIRSPKVGWQTYVALFRHRAVRRVILPAQMARLSVALEPLLLYVAVSQGSGSFSRGSWALAAYTVTIAVTWPLVGRLIDRQGARRVLLPLAVAHGAALVAFGWCGDWGWSLIPRTVLVAATLGPVGPAIRAAWTRFLSPGEELERANALESVLVEVFFIAGPLLSGAFVATLGVAAGLVASAVMLLLGSLGLAAVPGENTRSPSAEAGSKGSKGSVRDWWRLLVPLALASAAFGVVEVSVPATIGDAGSIWLLSLPPMSSVLGGLVYGAMKHSRSPVARYRSLVAIAFVTLLPFPFASSSLTLGFALFLLGVPLAAVSAEEFGILGLLSGTAAATHAFSVAATSMAVGGAVGHFLAGTALEWSGEWAARLAAPLLGLTALLWVAMVAGSLTQGIAHASGAVEA